MKREKVWLEEGLGGEGEGDEGGGGAMKRISKYSIGSVPETSAPIKTAQGRVRTLKSWDSNGNWYRITLVILAIGRSTPFSETNVWFQEYTTTRWGHPSLVFGGQ